MDKVILEFTFNGRKNTYLRRIDIFGKPLTTTNENSAKLIKEKDILNHIKRLIKEYGGDSIKDIAVVKEGKRIPLKLK